MSDHDEDERDGRLRSAMLHDGQPRFPWWLPLPGLALAALWAAYAGATGEGGAADAARTLLWPGPAIALVTTVATYFGWRLDLD